MDFSVIGAPLTGIEIGARGIREIAQNVRTILTTIRGTVFLDRAFGVNGDIVDKPVTAAMALFTGDIIAEVERQEPRVKVVRVEFESGGPGSGRLYPKVTLRIRDGVLL
jgi:phage baseplate assembly protein W